MAIIVLLGIGIIIVVIYSFRKYRKVIYGESSDRNPLIESGLVFPLRTSDINIKSREDWTENEEEISRISMLDSLYGKEGGVSKSKRIISVLVYEGNLNGSTVRYVSKPIYKDEVSLRFSLSKIEYVKVYVDQNNVNNYYFDLSFLV